MMTNYNNYLASTVLGDEKVVTYRLLSRALKVHVNSAKEMLYEFHRLQNGKKPGSVHATYLISGTKRADRVEDRDPIASTTEEERDGEDAVMQSSPFQSSLPSQLDQGTGASSALTITLTREEDLDQIRSQYEQVTSIHIYSLAPTTFKDLQILSDSSRELYTLTASEDPLSSLATYGTITNPAVKRRTNRRPPPALASVSSVQAKPKVEATPSTKTEPKPSQPTNAKNFFGNGKEKTKAVSSSATSSKENTPAPPPSLKKESSSLFKSFAKAKPKVKKEETGTESEVASAVDDEIMKDVSDDEEETYVPPAPSTGIVDSDRKSRKEREAALKKMMEDDDDENEVVPTPPEPKEDFGEALEDAKPTKEEEPVVEVKDGRRRGRRRVTKKKTVKDDEGYLVTKEEMVWESFSEDEPVAASKPKQKSTSQTSSQTSKAKKGAGKAGQGNIMSFFGKK